MIQVPCNCEQKEHRAALEQAIIEKGALQKLPEVLKDYKRVYLIADENTYEAAGKSAEQILKAAGIFSHSLILPSPVLPDDKTIGCAAIEAYYIKSAKDISRQEERPDYLLAVGSGTLNDISRVVSHRMGIPYGIVGTAPSMDGYASAGSPILHRNSKMTVQCTTPRHIFADPEQMAQAPYPMLLAGIGDMAGKYVALLDWELAHWKIGEYYCEKIASDVLEATNRCLKNAARLKERNPEVMQAIMEGLIVSGLGMAFTGVSRPAAGGEHMIAHVWEVMDIQNELPPRLHGLEVGEGTMAAIFCYRKLYQESDDNSLKKRIEKYLPLFDRVEKLYQTVEIPFPVLERNKFIDGIVQARSFRKRYTFLELIGQMGKLEEYAALCADALLES